MSQIYNLEPPTKGLIVLHTTHGDIEVELWPKEAPKAVRNFTQLCMEGYYDNTIFHRIIKDFMVQGGDPSGTGRGGESIYGRPFKNEFHSRLKFSHRGLVACANATGQADGNSNGSQFFVTLERADHLDRQATIFGRVTGDTIFTVLRLAEVEVDDADRPVDAPHVVSAEVLWPPFDDIAPRTTPADRRAAAEEAAAIKAKADLQLRKQKGKKLQVLSFGDEAEEDEAEADAGAAVRFRSAHETLRDDARLQAAEVGVHDAHVAQLQARLVAERERARRDAAAEEASRPESEPGVKDADAFARGMRDKVHAKRGHQQAPDVPGTAEGQGGSGSEGEGGPASPAKRRKVDKLSYSKDGKGIGAARQKQNEVADAELLTQYQLSLAQFRQRKRVKGGREKDILGKLKSFQAKLRQQPGKEGAAGEVGAAAGTADAGAGYSGQVNTEIDHRAYMPPAWRVDQYLEDGDDDSLQSLRAHRLHWNADDQVADPTRRQEHADDYKVVDPLLEAGKAAFSKKQQAAKKRQNEWAGGANM